MNLLEEVRMFAKEYPWISGLLVAQVLGSYVIKLVNDWMKKSREDEIEKHRKDSKLEREPYPVPDRALMGWLLGVVERMLYILAFVYGPKEFIGLWLSLKFAGHWKQYDACRPFGWGRINIFLVGNGLSILFALAGASIINLK